MYLTTALQPTACITSPHGPNRPWIAHLPADHGGRRFKHKGKPRNETREATTATTGSAAAGGEAAEVVKPDPENPFNMADLEHAWKMAGVRYGEELRQLRAGGRASPEFLGSVPVRLDRKASATVPLSELAVVVPKGGRRYGILCAEAHHKAAVKSAVQNSPHFNQQPQDSPDDELELLVLVEPEKAADVGRRVGETCTRWRKAIRDARASRDKTHQQWQGKKVVTVDDKRRLDAQLQKLQDAQMVVVKKKEAETMAALKKSDLLV